MDKTDTSLSEKHKMYFFLKVGFRNSLVEICKDVENNDKAQFWIGYSDCGYERLENNFNSHYFNIIPKYNQKQKKVPKDYLLLFQIAKSDLLRKRSRVVIFFQDKLEIWEIEKLRPLYNADQNRITSRLLECDDRYKEFSDAFSIKKVKTEKEKEKEVKKNIDVFKPTEDRGSKILECKRIISVPIYKLLPCINSLSGYQGLNRGTFRAFSSIAGGDREELLKQLFEEKDKNTYPGLLKNKNFEETFYGMFVRLYFEWIENCKIHADETFQGFLNKNIGGFLDDEQVKKLALLTISPGQVETLALLILIDFGFGLEIGVAKSLKDIDVRGKVVKGFNGTPLTPEDLLKELGCSDNVKKKFEKYGIIDIQCKDYMSITDPSELKEGKIIYLQADENKKSDKKDNVWKIAEILELLKKYKEDREKMLNTKKWLKLLTDHFICKFNT